MSTTPPSATPPSATPPPPPGDPAELGERIGAGIGRGLEWLLTILASLVFVGLWVYVAAAAFTDGGLLADTWEWISGLDIVPAIVVWIAFLPICVFLWAWQAELEPIWMGLVMVGMVIWTGIAWSGLIRLIVRRR